MSTTITNPTLHALADDMGVKLVRHNGGLKGWYDHTRRQISTRRGLSIYQYRATLAHELGHAHHGDYLTGNPLADIRMERRADQFAAELLISEEAYQDAHVACGGHFTAIADELEVTQHLLRVWMRSRII